MQTRHSQVNLKLNKWTIGLIIISLLVGGVVGAVIGAKAALTWCVNKAVYFLDLKGIDIEMNVEEIANAIQMYKYQIDLCYPTIKNASIYNNSGN